MESNTSNVVYKNNKLFKLAKKRAAFKYNLLSFILVNIVIWSIWFTTFKNTSDNKWPWPLWPMLMWGIAICYTYLHTYFPKNYLAGKEYENLKNKQS